MFDSNNDQYKLFKVGYLSVLASSLIYNKLEILSSESETKENEGRPLGHQENKTNRYTLIN